VQLELDPLRDAPKVWGTRKKIFRENSITIVSGMVRCIGEAMPRWTPSGSPGGIAPDAKWDQNVKNISACAPRQEMG